MMLDLEKIKVPIAFLVVLVIWSTTPLAIKWSASHAPMSSALLRMIVGALFCLSLLGLTTTKLPLNAPAIRLYVFNGLTIFFGMSLFYLAAQHIPSGWIAVLFGLSPLLTGLLSALVEPETKLKASQFFGIALGFAGLYLVFHAGLNVADASLIGVIYSFIATFIGSLTSVVTRQLVKQVDISGMQITSGSLIVALPLFALTAYLSQPENPFAFSQKELWSTLYLGLVGTGIGFSLYYFLLKKVTANRVALITLVTPICALMIGSWLNNEPLIGKVWLGASLVCIGLLIYEFKPKLGLRKLTL